MEGRAGRLEAVLNIGVNNATYAAVVCHPHPLYGGTLHNKVVFHAMKALNHFGFPVLRFNFRGTGLSEGEHDFGSGEVDDVQVALDWLKNEFHLPIVFAGFSFGAATGLRVACPDPDVKAIISLGTPFSAEGRLYSYEYLGACNKPKLFVSGGADQYANRAQLEQLAATTPNATLVIVDEVDHFFAGRLDQMRTAIETWIVAQGIASAPSAD
jgi:alpha/beta superfamily hydrolase